MALNCAIFIALSPLTPPPTLGMDSWSRSNLFVDSSALSIDQYRVVASTYKLVYTPPKYSYILHEWI